MKKTVIIMLSFVLAFSLLLTACGKNNEDNGNKDKDSINNTAGKTQEPIVEEPANVEPLKGEIKIMVPGGGKYLPHVTDYIAKKFMEKNPEVKVITEQEPEGGQLTARISSGDVPDIYIGVFGYLPAKYAKEKLITDLKDMPGSKEVFDRLAPQYVHEDFGGRYYVPWNSTTQLMIYNKDLFREAGLDPEKPPVTFDQYLEYAKKIDALPKRADGSKVYGNYFWNQALSWGGWYWTMKSQIYYNFNGGKYGLFNSTGTDIAFDKPEAKMAEFLEFMNEAQKLAPESSENNDFFKRDKGMWLQFGYGWKANLKDAKDKPMVIGEDVGVAPIPTLNEGDPHYSTLDGRSLMIFKSNPDREKLAFEFIKFMMEDEINLESLKVLEQLPTLKSLESNEYFQASDIKPFVNQLEYAIPNEPVAELDDASNILLGNYVKYVIKHEISAEETVKVAAEESRAKLKQ